MIVAEVIVISGRGFNEAIKNVAYFDAVDAAKAEYDRTVDLMTRMVGRKNDLPPQLTCKGTDTEFTVPLDEVNSVAMVDYAKSNEARRGLVEAFPNVFRR